MHAKYNIILSTRNVLGPLRVYKYSEHHHANPSSFLRLERCGVIVIEAIVSYTRERTSKKHTHKHTHIHTTPHHTHTYTYTHTHTHTHIHTHTHTHTHTTWQVSLVITSEHNSRNDKDPYTAVVIRVRGLPLSDVHSFIHAFVLYGSLSGLSFARLCINCSFIQSFICSFLRLSLHASPPLLIYALGLFFSPPVRLHWVLFMSLCFCIHLSVCAFIDYLSSSRACFWSIF